MERERGEGRGWSGGLGGDRVKEWGKFGKGGREVTSESLEDVGEGEDVCFDLLVGGQTECEGMGFAECFVGDAQVSLRWTIVTEARPASTMSCATSCAGPVSSRASSPVKVSADRCWRCRRQRL